MSVKLGVLALLEAKPEKGDDLGRFLEQGRALAVAEEGTVTWYAFKVNDTTYGIFDTFEDADGRHAHLDGEIPTALAASHRNCWPATLTSGWWTSSPSNSAAAARHSRRRPPLHGRARARRSAIDEPGRCLDRRVH